MNSTITLYFEGSDTLLVEGGWVTPSGDYVCLHEQLEDVERITYFRSSTVKKIVAIHPLLHDDDTLF